MTAIGGDMPEAEAAGLPRQMLHWDGQTHSWLRGWADDEEQGYYLEELWIISTLGPSTGREEAITERV